METRDWIQIFAITVLISGWFINGYLNRRNEIAKKRIEFVLPTLKSFLKIWYILTDPEEQANIDPIEYKKLLIEIRENFQLYGREDERALFEEFVSFSTRDNYNPNEAKRTMEQLVQIVRERIRQELNIE